MALTGGVKGPQLVITARCDCAVEAKLLYMIGHCNRVNSSRCSFLPLCANDAQGYTMHMEDRCLFAEVRTERLKHILHAQPDSDSSCCNAHAASHIFVVHLGTCADEACTYMSRNLVKECMEPDSKTASSKTSTDMLRWSWKAYLMPRLSSKQQKRLHRQYV